MVALNVDIWSQAGVSHWASTSSKGTHSTATDTMLVWASCEEVVVMAIFSSTRPSGWKMDDALIEDLMPPPSWKAEGHVASPKHEWFWVVAKL